MTALTALLINIYFTYITTITNMPNPIFSDALPIQIWRTGEESFNQHEDCFVESECYNYEWQVDDTIRLVFTDDPGLSYVLKAIDLSGTICTLNFIEVYPGTYVLYFKPSENGLVDRCAYISIQHVTLMNNTDQFVPAQLTANALNDQFVSDLNGWSGGNVYWANNFGGSMQFSFYPNPGVGTCSKLFTPPANAISMSVTVNGYSRPETGETNKVEFKFFSGSTVIKAITLINGYGDFSTTFTVNRSVDPTVFTNTVYAFITGTANPGAVAHLTYIKDVKIDYNYLDISSLVQSGSGSGWTGSPLYGGSVLYTSGGEATGKEITKVLPVSESKTFNVTWDSKYNAGASGTSRLEFVAYGPDNVVHVLGHQDMSATNNNQFIGTFSGLSTYTHFGVRFQSLTSTGSITIAVETLQFDFQTGDTTGTETGFSDYLKFSSVVTNSIGIFYKSVKLFADIPYQDLTGTDPASPYFFIRVPGVFYHDSNQTESKTIDLSNSKTITTSSTLKRRREFDIQDAPDYMHLKIQLILMHNVSGSVVINNVEWVYDGNYELTQRGEYGGVAKDPFKFAKAFLVRKNYVVHNVI